MPGDILDMIDSALTDWPVSADAMRYNPEAAETETRCRNSADFSLAMLPPVEAFGLFSAYPPVSLAIAAIQEGDTIQFDDRTWRVAGIREDGSGMRTFDLEPFTA